MSEKKQKITSTDFKKETSEKVNALAQFNGYETLTKKQETYFRMMFGRSGVLFITAEPGVAKSAIMRSIAKKLGMNYFDVRLSMVDEIDVGLFPYRKEKEIEVTNDEGVKVVDMISVMAYAIPEWAYEANQKPCIIHFEELNRAPLAVRNAALQILLERSIGTKFKFNDNVFMVSSGNLGEADGTDVEEFDRALNNRLIHVGHTLTLPEWIEDFATENVHSVIIDFLKTHEEHFLSSLDEKKSKLQVAYATPRSWTFLSDYIIRNYGKNSSISDWSRDMSALASSFVGDGAAQKFIRYLSDVLQFGVQDILDRYDEIKSKLEKANRDKKSELLNTLKTMDITKLSEKQMENLKKFILTISKDEATSFLLKIIDDDYKFNSNDNENNLIETFMKDKRFFLFYDAIEQHLDDVQ